MSSVLLGKSSSNKHGQRVGGGVAVDHGGGRVAVPRQVVSVLTCSKLCGICFVAGIVVGFTLKRRVRCWAAKLLKKISDE